MWVKGVTVLVLATLVCGCGQAVSDTQETAQSSGNQLEPQKQLPGTDIFGALPTTPPPLSVEKVQALFEAEILKGVPEEKFSKFEIKPEQTIIGSSSGQMKNPPPTDKHTMFLVRSHLELIENACTKGQGYKGWIAVKPALIINANGPVHKQKFVRPYRVLICETDGHLDYEIIELGAAFAQATK